MLVEMGVKNARWNSDDASVTCPGCLSKLPDAPPTLADIAEALGCSRDASPADVLARAKEAAKVLATIDPYAAALRCLMVEHPFSAEELTDAVRSIEDQTCTPIVAFAEVLSDVLGFDEAAVFAAIAAAREGIRS